MDRQWIDERSWKFFFLSNFLVLDGEESCRECESVCTTKKKVNSSHKTGVKWQAEAKIHLRYHQMAILTTRMQILTWVEWKVIEFSLKRRKNVNLHWSRRPLFCHSLRRVVVLLQLTHFRPLSTSPPQANTRTLLFVQLLRDFPSRTLRPLFSDFKEFHVREIVFQLFSSTRWNFLFSSSSLRHFFFSLLSAPSRMCCVFDFDVETREKQSRASYAWNAILSLVLAVAVNQPVRNAIIVCFFEESSVKAFISMTLDPSHSLAKGQVECEMLLLCSSFTLHRSVLHKTPPRVSRTILCSVDRTMPNHRNRQKFKLKNSALYMFIDNCQ